MSTISFELLKLIPRHELPDFQEEDIEAQNQALRWADICDQIKNAPQGNKGQIIQAVSDRTGKSVATINYKLGRYKKLGWQGLINRAKYPEPNSSGLPKAFRMWVPALYSRFQRNNAAKQVHRYLLDRLAKWRATLNPEHAIPGYTSPPADAGNGYPKGWSYKSIQRLKPSAFNLKQARQGNKAATAHLPNNYTTRCGLKFGQRFFFDDQQHDIKVNLLGRNSRAMRPMGFNSLDHLSGWFADYTCKMTLWDDGENRSRSLKQKDFTWFAIHNLLHVGYRDDATGTVYIFEHGTATGWLGFDEALHHVTNGRVIVDRSGRFNDPLFEGMLFRPQSTGNFKFKSPLESIFNLDRNYMAALPGQIGSNQRMNGMEEHYGMDKYNNQLIKLYHSLPDVLRDKIQFPFLTWPEFTAIQAETYQLINARTDHNLEGWEKCGFTASRFRLDPSQPWQDREVLRNIDPARARAISDLAEWRVFPLSPQEVANRHKHELTKLNPRLVPLLLNPEWMIDVTVNANHEIHIKDTEAGSDPFIYIASIKSKGGQTTLDAGTKLKAQWHPLTSEHCWIFTESGAFIGVLDQFIKPTAGDTPAIISNQGTINAVKSDLNQWTKRNLGAVRNDRQKMVEHNRQLAAGEETDPKKRRQQKASKSAAARFGRNLSPAQAPSTPNADVEEDWSDQPVAEAPSNNTQEIEETW